MKNFTNHIIQLQKGDIIYLKSDGFEDQFGGPKGRKFLTSNLKKLINEQSQKSLPEQKEVLEKTIESWRNDYNIKYNQTDDITIMGVRV